jgi:Fe-S-cluster-containing dehydrogenase component
LEILPEIKKLITIEPDKCTSCRICEIICSQVKTGMCNPALSRIKVISDMVNGVDVPVLCLHCEEPLCRDVCPVGAIDVDLKSGIVKIKEDDCIGCRLCIMVCPYGGISYNPQTRKVMKCDLCDGDPMCVKYCEPKAISFTRADMASMKKKRLFMQEKIKPIILASRKTGEAEGGL